MGYFNHMNSAELLKEECKLHNAQFTDIDQEYPGFYEILDEVIKKPPHENVEQVFGLIFAKSFFLTNGILKLPYFYGVSDGETIFELFEQSSRDADVKKSTLIFDYLLDQKLLLSLSIFHHTILFIKQMHCIRIYYKGSIYVIENRTWKIYNPIDDYILRMQKHYRELNFIQFREILSFAFHELSLNKIGATIVYLLNRNDTIPNAVNTFRSEINFGDIKQRRLLKNFLRYHDGAVAINLNNQVIQTNAFLVFSTEADKYVQNYSGTRHTSAAKYSFENPETIVVVISADGPVSVFSEGKNIDVLTVNTSYKINEEMERTYNDGEHTKSEDEYTEHCENCGKTFIINAITFEGWQTKESLRCSVCGHEYFSKNCSRLEHRLVKML
jgi:DNA integrity scanning protein DisA with diadenylate cyclase activity/DNA-directed RNA polymerase subunit RPC12/RpoP